MRRKNHLSINHICIFLGLVLWIAAIGISIAVLWMTRNVVATLSVLGFGVFAFGCGVLFVRIVRKKLVLFSDQLCELLDGMMSGKEELPEEKQQKEGLFYKIHYRLKRLYEVMQENRNHIAKEREDLQELISDISHQVKTPIASLGMIHYRSYDAAVSWNLVTCTVSLAIVVAISAGLILCMKEKEPKQVKKKAKKVAPKKGW